MINCQSKRTGALRFATGWNGVGVGKLLSAAMIVKKDERFLDGSLAGMVDEIIVVDTGSIDEGLTIAATHGASVHDHVWCDDFSAARVEARDLATGVGIFYIDAHEPLLPYDHLRLARKLADHSLQIALTAFGVS